MKPIALFVRGNPRLHRTPQRGLGANLIEISRTVRRFSFERSGKHFLDLLPVFGRHVHAFLCFMSRCSQALAVAHSRFTVAGEMLRTSEVSSIERPPKNRS